MQEAGVVTRRLEKHGLETDERVSRLRQFFETLTPQSLAGLGSVYAEQVYFKDPFNEVTGLAAVRRVFEHMFVQVDSPQFVIDDVSVTGDHAFLTWDFRFHFKRGDRRQQCIRGASHLRFAPDGRVSYHRDYWDAAEELYEKLPALGSLLRWIKRRAVA